jgi:hypothetical protein
MLATRRSHGDPQERHWRLDRSIRFTNTLLDCIVAAV